MRNLIPVSDAWTMLPDGTVAAVREYDYHVDWITPNGTRDLDAEDCPRVAAVHGQHQTGS